MEKINIHHPRAHFIIINSSSIVFTLWKWGETISTTSLHLIRTSSNWLFPDISVFTNSGNSLCSNQEWIRKNFVFTTTRHSKSSISDVARLVATEDVRNKYSLRESLHLKSVVVQIASIQSYFLIKLHLLQSFKPSDSLKKVDLFSIFKSPY